MFTELQVDSSSGIQVHSYTLPFSLVVASALSGPAASTRFVSSFLAAPTLPINSLDNPPARPPFCPPCLAALPLDQPGTEPWALGQLLLPSPALPPFSAIAMPGACQVRPFRSFPGQLLPPWPPPFHAIGIRRQEGEERLG